jgi:Flp pilus assembly protein TadB
MKLRNLLIAAIGLAVTAGAAGAASAATPWQTHHPRRVEVNHRLATLNHSLRVERREGDLTALQERRLHERTHMIRVQERNFARHDGGHITRHEQRRLNHEETGVRHHIPR